MSIEKKYCGHCQKYTEPDYIGMYILEEVCEKCNLDYRSHGIPSGEKYEFETKIQNKNFLVKLILRFYRTLLIIEKNCTNASKKEITS